MNTFAHHVTTDTMLRAGFNEDAVSVSFNKEGKRYHVHLATYPDTNLNIVVIQEKGKKVAWYLGGIRGTPLQERETEAAAAEFMGEVERLITPRNRVAGRALDAGINDLLSGYSAEQYGMRRDYD